MYMLLISLHLSSWKRTPTRNFACLLTFCTLTFNIFNIMPFLQEDLACIRGHTSELASDSPVCARWRYGKWFKQFHFEVLQLFNTISDPRPNMKWMCALQDTVGYQPADPGLLLFCQGGILAAGHFGAWQTCQVQRTCYGQFHNHLLTYRPVEPAAWLQSLILLSAVLCFLVQQGNDCLVLRSMDEDIKCVRQMRLSCTWKICSWKS